MAKKNFGNIADEFLTKSGDTSIVEPQSTRDKNAGVSNSVFGRPKAKDLNGEEVKKLGVYITGRQFKKLTIYSANNDMDKSEAMRHILNTFFDGEHK